MTPEQMLAGLQQEVKRLAETVQRPQKKTLRTVTMANEVARLNKPTGFIGDEDEYGDWDFALTCFVGTIDGTLLKELQSNSIGPKGEANPGRRSWERELYNILALRTKGKKDGTRGTRPKEVRSVPKSRTEILGAETLTEKQRS